jgi:hypothetical protein
MARIRETGTIYKETDPRRITKWRAEKYLTLPNGMKKRIVCRGDTQAQAVADDGLIFWQFIQLPDKSAGMKLPGPWKMTRLIFAGAAHTQHKGRM